jgi:serine/threonine protein kinase
MLTQPNSITYTCPACHQLFTLLTVEPLRFCPLCGHALKIASSSPDNLLSNRYQLIESIGKGGMGEVFLAIDTSCGRRIALKKIRSDLLEHPQIRHRFLKEAHITCQLMHPGIIPIYSIQADLTSAYYTMPFVEGETLKQIIRKTRQQEKQGEKLDHLGGSIPALMRVFITICQAVAYAHSKGVLHRDLKPENVIIGKYGEVLILDWGLAKYIHPPTPEEEDLPPPTQVEKFQRAEITRIGKVVGTVAYMAPERGMGQPATIQTDIYSLGVILYQLLTLRTPFQRGTLEEFRKSMANEEWVDPVLVAPYRDVPHMLARLAKKCLNRNPQKRFSSVDELIYELENYLEGRSEWFKVAELEIKRKNDWEFQEHVLIAEHVAITRVTEETEWVNLMISRQSFTGNTRLETTVCLGEEGHGVGILLSIPEASERTYINDGYCLWLGSDQQRSTKLLRSNVEVMQAPDIFLQRHQWTRIRIEKIDKTIHLYLDDVLQFSYIAHLPLIGTHIGLLSRDANFEMGPLVVSVGSLNLTVNCLAVPDAFLAHHDFAQALSEYRRIAYSFPDRVEGREALFRAGLTFLEQAKGATDKIPLLEHALKEFEKLHQTPGGPLEYLGKALVYQALNDAEEEIKCFEIAYRRYPKHPLLLILQEQILSRMHEVSRQDRMTTYRFILLTVRHFSPSAIDTHTQRLFTSLQKHWEILPFIEEQASKAHPLQMLRFAIPLAFWLAKPYILGEIIEDLYKSEQPAAAIEMSNALVCLIKLGAYSYARHKLEKVKSRVNDPKRWQAIEQLLACAQEPLEPIVQALFVQPVTKLDFSQKRLLVHLFDQALVQRQPALIHTVMLLLEHCELSFEAQLAFNIRRIEAFLLEKKWEQAGELFYAYPVELLNKGTTPLHFLYGCWLQGTEGREMAMIHFTGLLHVTYPRTWTLASHALAGDLLQGTWPSKAFLWEKRELYRQLALYYECAGEDTQREHYLQLYQQQFISIDDE